MKLPPTVVELSIITGDCKNLRYNAWCKAFGIKQCPNYIKGIITDPVTFDMVMIVIFDAFAL